MQSNESTRDESRYCVAPLHFIVDLKYSDKSLRGRGKLCGVGREMVSRILDGLPVNRERLKMAMANFYGKNRGNMMGTQMRGIVLGSRAGSHTFMRLLRNTAKIVERFEDAMKVSSSSSQFYVFPPQNSVLSMVKAVETCGAMLRELHHQCPEFDSAVFRDAKALLKKIKKEDELGEK